MFKRVSLVRRRPDLSVAEFTEAWLGEHVDHARRLPGLREYVVDIVEDSPPEGPDGIATVRFDTREACVAAFATPGLHSDLMRTRDDFAADVRVLYVAEHHVHPAPSESPR